MHVYEQVLYLMISMEPVLSTLFVWGMKWDQIILGKLPIEDLQFSYQDQGYLPSECT
jgi:hypothetical protein